MLCYVASVVSDSLWPQRRQPTRLRRPWDSPARILEWVAISFSSAWKEKSESEVVQSCLTLSPLQPTRLLRPWDFPGKSTGVGCHCLLHANPRKNQIWKQTITMNLIHVPIERCLSSLTTKHRGMLFALSSVYLPFPTWWNPCFFH